MQNSLSVIKSGPMYADTHVSKSCIPVHIYAKCGKFAPGSDLVQISICLNANFAYMHILQCEPRAKFANEQMQTFDTS